MPCFDAFLSIVVNHVSKLLKVYLVKSKVETVMSQVVFQLQARTRAGSKITAKSDIKRGAMHNGRNPFIV